MGNVSTSVQNYTVTGDNNSLDGVAKIIPTTSVTVDPSDHVNEANLSDITPADIRVILDAIDANSRGEHRFLDSYIGESERGFGLYPSKKIASAVIGKTSIPLTGLTALVEMCNKVTNIGSSIDSDPALARAIKKASGPIKTLFGTVFNASNALTDAQSAARASMPTLINSAINNSESLKIITEFANMTRGKDDDTDPTKTVNGIETSSIPLSVFFDKASGTNKPTSNVDPLLTGATKVPIGVYGDSLQSMIQANTLTDRAEQQAKSDLAASTFSSRDILITPPNETCSNVLSSVSQSSEALSSLRKTLQMAGPLYGFSTAGNIPSQSPGSNFIQTFTDSTPCAPDKPFLNVGQLRTIQQQAVSDTKIDISTLMAASPTSIPANFIRGVNNFHTTELRDIFKPIDPVDRMKYITDMTYCNTLAVAAKTNATSYPSAINALENSTMFVHTVIDTAFTLDEPFVSYSIVTTITFDFICTTTQLPGYLCTTKDAMDKLLFVPALKMDNSTKSFQTTIPTANLVPIKFPGFDKEALFLLASVSKDQRQAGSSYCYTITSANSTATPTRPLMNLPGWYYDGVLKDQPMIDFAFTISPGIISTAHPCDVTKAYSQLLAPYAQYIPSVLTYLADESKSPLTHASFYTYVKRTFSDPDQSEVVGKDQDYTSKWLLDLIADLPDLMIYRGESPFARVELKFVPGLAYKILSIFQAHIGASLYTLNVNTSQMSALKSITNYASHTDSVISKKIEKLEHSDESEHQRLARMLRTSSNKRMQKTLITHHTAKLLATAGH